MNTKNNDSSAKHIVLFFIGVATFIFIILFIFPTVIYALVIKPHKVSGNVMYPAFKNGAFIFSEKITYYSNNPQRGDIVIYQNPESPEKDRIGRIIGLPNEKIKIEKGYVFINGKQYSESYIELENSTYEGDFLKEGAEYMIPDSNYFIMGDNRKNSRDSRYIGPISEELIKGKVSMCYWNC